MTQRLYKPYGDFGNIAQEYDKHRLPYDKSTFAEVFSQMYFKPSDGQTEFRFLDVGCGTGHSTFTLADAAKKYLPHGSTFKIVGIDIDPRMIHKAQKNNTDTQRIVFTTAPIDDHLDIGRNFDMILCVSAFHWVSQEHTVVSKIYSLLRGSFNEGKSEKFPFIVINRNIVEPTAFQTNLRKHVAQSLNITPEDLPNIKSGYSPSQTLTKHRFVRGLSIANKEIKSNIPLQKLLLHATTNSLWNLIPNEKREEVFDRFCIEMGEYAKDGIVEIKEWYTTTYGYRQY